ncbi:unnamed protein product [Nyctereutes procyonoides]|uniref:(raccoon dog) hypothetical protein n=1 Tax=Nyctereutes procyonoides TaxID=34880 RepID=A0A811ZKI6_NYCPR|nr:unnamed protein product [Nyctereutes procyonoides]
MHLFWVLHKSGMSPCSGKPHCSGPLPHSLHLSRWPRKPGLTQGTCKCSEERRLSVTCG